MTAVGLIYCINRKTTDRVGSKLTKFGGKLVHAGTPIAPDPCRLHRFALEGTFCLQGLNPQNSFVDQVL